MSFQASLVTQMAKSPPAMQETLARSWVMKTSWRRNRLPPVVFLPGESPWIAESGKLHSPWGHKELDVTEQLSTSFHGLVAHFFSVLNDIQLSGYTTVNLFTYWRTFWLMLSFGNSE